MGKQLFQGIDAVLQKDLAGAVFLMKLAEEFPAAPTGGDDAFILVNGNEFYYAVFTGGYHSGSRGVFCTKPHGTGGVNAHAGVYVALWR